MSYMIVWPGTEDEEEDPPLSRLKQLLKALRYSDDEEHGYASVSHDSGWYLEVEANGFIRWSNLNDDVLEPDNEGRTPQWYQDNVSDEKLLELWTLLATGQIDRIRAEPWTVLNFDS